MIGFAQTTSAAFQMTNGTNKVFHSEVPSMFMMLPQTQTTFTLGSQSVISLNKLGATAANSGRYMWLTTANNGFLYGFHFSLLNNVIKIDPVRKTFTTFGSVSNSVRCAIKGVDGRIYGIPSGGSTIAVINPANDTVSTFGTITSVTNGYWSGALAPNGIIYAPPYAATPIMKINTNNSTVSTFGNLGAGNKYISATLAPNGKIYCAPYALNTILVINPADDSTYTITIPNDLIGNKGSQRFYGSKLGYDGRIYCFNYGASRMLIIDPSNDTISTTSTFGYFNPSYTTFSLGSMGYGGVAANGKMYISVGFASRPDWVFPRELDIYKQTLSSVLFGQPVNDITLDLSSTPFGNGCLAPNGEIYFAPSRSSHIIYISGLPPATEDMWKTPTDISKIHLSRYNIHSNGA